MFTWFSFVSLIVWTCFRLQKNKQRLMLRFFPFLIFSISYLRPSLLPQNYIPESITFLNCKCNVFRPYVAIIVAAAIKKDCSYRNNCSIRLHAGDLEHSLVKEKNKIFVCLSVHFMFCHSRFRFRNLKKANLCMFSWCITATSLLICSWHDMTQPVGRINLQYLQ